MSEKLVQRLPLLAAAAGICFIFGSMFGAACAMTIGRGVKRHRNHKQRRRLVPTPAENESNPTYTELPPAPSSSDSSVRRDNDYMELGNAGSSQAQSSGTPPTECCNGVTVTSSCMETLCTASDGTPNSAEIILPPTPPDSQQALLCSCIEEDLDALERVVQQQN